jgi:hypothetical protein
MVAERRFVQQAQVRSHRMGAHRRVRALLQTRTPDPQALPPVVRTLLDEGWTPAMVQAYTDGGERSEHWRLGERVLVELLWSVAPKRDPAERRELLRCIPELLRDLRACLATVITDQQRLARWLKELQTVHIGALRGRVDAAPGRPQRQSAAAAPAAATHAGDVDALPLGSWLGLSGDDGSVERFKLVWRGDQGASLLFVDRLGAKAFELSRTELQALLAQDLACVIGGSGLPLVDRAMDAVRHSLSIH